MASVVRDTLDMLQQLYMLIQSSRTISGNSNIELTFKIDPQEELNAQAEWAKNNENNRDHNFGLEDTFEAIALGFVLGGN